MTIQKTPRRESGKGRDKVQSFTIIQHSRRSGKFMPALIASRDDRPGRDDPPYPPRLMSKPNVHSIAFGGSQAPCKSGSFLDLTLSRITLPQNLSVFEIKIWVQLCNLANIPANPDLFVTDSAIWRRIRGLKIIG